VRINIRPFCDAKVLNGRGKSAAFSGRTPRSSGTKIAERNPTAKDDFPWFCLGMKRSGFAGGKEFDGNRLERHALHPKVQAAARERHAEDKKRHKG